MRAGLASLCLAALAVAVAAEAAAAHLLAAPAVGLPSAQSGVVYSGLVPGTGLCEGVYRLTGISGPDRCTHGPDPAPPGIDVTEHVPTSELKARADAIDLIEQGSSAPGTAASAPVCEGDGQSGKRVQAVYARAADATDRFASVEPLIRQYAAAMDDDFDASAALTGGSRRIRFVTNASCQIVVENVVLSSFADDDFDTTVTEMQDLGYTDPSRKYLIWMDANRYCGIAQIYSDSAQANNANDGRSSIPGMIGRVDSSCWGLSSEAVEGHELTHTLGGVQTNAPHATAFYHCWDEHDLMCYDDDGGNDGSITLPNGNPHALQTVCLPKATYSRLLDCNSDDYFNVNPPAASYLATHWDVANNSFLIANDTPVDTTITSGVPPGNDSTPTFTFTSNRAAATFECRLDALAFKVCSTPYTAPAQVSGPHTFEVRAKDSFGNLDPTPATLAFTVDTVKPNTTITAGPTLTNSQTPTFEFVSSEAGSTFQCKLDQGAYAGCASPFTTPSLTVAQHTFSVRAIDPAGNVDATPATRAVKVEQTPPQTTISSGPAAPTADTTPTFKFTSNETGSSFECRIDAAAFAACPATYTTAALPHGPHTIEARATDKAGNTDPTPATRAFSVDTVGPETQIDSGPPPLTKDRTPSFHLSASEAGAKFECSVDAAAFKACTAAYTTISLTDGSHTVRARAKDSLGNVDATPASSMFTVDGTQPNTTITAGPTQTADNTPTFEFTSTEPGSTFQCKLDGGVYAACSSPFTTPPLTVAQHSFSVRATDPAGNLDATPATRSVKITAAAPFTGFWGT